MDMANWLHGMRMTPRDLAAELSLSRVQVSALISGSEEPGKLMRWALAGLEASGPRQTDSVLRVVQAGSPLAESLTDESWAGETARLAMPILIEIAKSKNTKPITYGDLHAKVCLRGGKANVGTLSKYAYPCGRIARAAEDAGEIIDDEVPPLTALVVNGVSGLPSSGIDEFLRNYLGKTETRGWKAHPSKRRKAIEQVWADIANFERWDEVLAAVGLTGNPIYDR